MTTRDADGPSPGGAKSDLDPAAFDAAGIGTWHADLPGGPTVWSAVCERLHGVPSGAFGGSRAAFLDTIHPDDRAALEATIAAAVRDVGTFQADYRVRWPDGGERWLASWGRVEGEPGAPRRVSGVVVDIDARKRAEVRARLLARVGEALEAGPDLPARLAAIARLLVPDLADWCAVDLCEPGGLIRRLTVVHRDPDRAPLAADLAARYATIPADAPHVVARTIRSGQPRLDRDVSPGNVRRNTLDAGQADLVLALGIRDEMILPLVGHGETLGALTLVVSTPGRRYDDDALAFAREVAGRCAVSLENALLYEEARRDLAARRAAEDALSRSEERLRLGLASLPVSLFQQDRDLRYRWTSPSPGTLGPDETHGKADGELFPPEEAALLDAVKRQVLETGEPRRQEVAVTLPAGRRVFDLLLEPAFGPDGAVAGLNGAAIDVTDRRRREERIHLLQALTAELARSATTRDVVAAISSEGRERLGAERVTVAVLNGRRDGLRRLPTLAAGGGRSQPMIPLASDHPLAEAVRAGRPVVRVDPPAGAGRVTVAVPLVADGETTGGLKMIFPPGEEVDAEELAFIQTIGNLCAQSLARARLFDRELDARARLEAVETRFQATFEHAAVGMAHSRPDGRWLRVNPKLCELLGYTREELLRQSFLDLTHPDDREENARLHRALVAGEIGTYTYEKRFLRKDGTPLWVTVTVALVRDAAGRADYSIGVIEDISARKASEAERERLLREVEAERARLETVLRQLPVGVLIADAASGEVVMANAQVRAAVGDTLPWPAAPGADGADPLARAIRDGEVVVGEEVAIRRADGSEADLRVSAAPVRDRDGQVVAGVLTVEEITEERRAQAAARLLADAGDLLAAPLDDAALGRLARLPLPRLADACLIEVEHLDGTCAATVAADAEAERALRERYRSCALRERGDHPFAVLLRSHRPVLLPDAAGSAESAEWLGGPPPASLLIVPLLTRGEVFGLMTFLRDEPGRPFDEADAGLAQELARRAAAAIDNARLYADEQAARRNAEESSARIGQLQGLTSALAEALTVEQVAQIVVSEGIAAVGAQGGTVGLLTDDGATVEIVGAAGYADDEVARWHRFPLDAPIPFAEAVRTGEPRLLGTVAEGVDRYPTLRDSLGDERRALAVVPLLVDGRAVGAIALTFREERTFAPPEVAFLLALARQSAQALERARLYAAERRARTDAEAARARLAFLAEASVALGASLDYATTLRRLAEWVVPSLADWCTIHILREDGEVENLVVAHADPQKIAWARQLQERYPVDLERGAGVAEVLRTGVPQRLPAFTEAMVDAAAPDPDLAAVLRALGLTSAMIVPLVAQGETLGALTLVAAESGKHYGEEDLRFAEDLARRAAAAVSNARHYLAEERARREAERATVRKTRLQAITAALAEALTPEEVARVLVTEGVGALDAAAGSVALRQDDGTYRIVRWHGYDPELVDRWATFGPGARIPLADALRERRPILLRTQDALREAYPALAPTVEPGNHRAFAAIPVLFEGRALGALGLSFGREQAFEEDDVAFMTALARQSAVALERARLWEAERQARAQAEAAERLARREADRIAALADLSRAIAEAGLDLPAALDAAARITAERVGDCAVVRLLSEDGEWMDVAALAHPDPARLARYDALVGSHRQLAVEGFSARVLDSGEPLLLDDATGAPDLALAHAPSWRRMAEAGVGSLLVVPLRARGRRIGTLALMRDRPRDGHTADDVPFVQELADRAALAIDNARLYREARDAVRARDEFLSVAAHELRTPVTTVKGYAQLLRRAQDREGFASERARQFIDAIDGASDRLRLLADDLLDVSRLRLGQLPLRMRPVDPAALVAAATRRAQAQLGETHPITTAIATEGRVVTADPDRIDQILSNLLDNAAKYSATGAPIAVSAEPQDGGVLISVRDAGIGLPPAELESVFEPFRRASNAERANLPGLGLGLAICRSIAERHGGRVWAESGGEGQGTTMRLWLPREAGEDESRGRGVEESRGRGVE